MASERMSRKERDTQMTTGSERIDELCKPVAGNETSIIYLGGEFIEKNKVTLKTAPPFATEGTPLGLHYCPIIAIVPPLLHSAGRQAQYYLDFRGIAALASATLPKADSTATRQNGSLRIEGECRDIEGNLENGGPFGIVTVT